MTYKIEEIEGIGPVYGEKLVAAGIVTTDDLLDKCCAPEGRAAIAEATGMSESTLVKWTNLADLMRIKGIGRQYSELLEGAGVDTIKELRTRDPEHLAAKMEEVNKAKNYSGAAPRLAEVTEWIAAAKDMKPRMTY
jgi:predicted flap endonuclease-1-like 5' DNA nuclease